MDELTREFLIESQEGLDRMEQCLTELEGRPDDADLIGEIFRAVHTIKGTTGFLAFHRLESLSHAGESLLAQVRDGRVRATSPVITCLLRLMDGLRSILQLIGATGDEGKRADDDDADLIAEIRSFQAAPEPQGGEKRSLDGGGLSKSGDAVPDRSWRSLLAQTPSSGEFQTAPTAAADFKPTVELAMPLPMSATLPSSPLDVHGNPANLKQTVAPPSLQDSGASPESTLRVDVELLNRMMNMVGELVLTRNRILQTTANDESFAALGHRLDRVTAELREAVMKARMQPVGHVFQKFPRMVRDLARTCGRQVRLELEGQETELDKSLLEAVRDPLTHAVRNSVDHGIESPEARLLAGKPREGVLRLRASQQGGHIVIEVSDDGAGISPEKILAAALARKLIDPAKAASLGPREVLQLIFLPGFSTATEVTNISGRGVGMDVVRANVERIGGKVELDSEQGVGTRLRMRIPLTLAIIPALVVKTCGQSFAVPHSALFELVRVAAGGMDHAVEWVGQSPVYRLRNQLLPVVWLDRLLELDAVVSEAAVKNAARPQAEKPSYLVVLEADGTRFCLVVDELLDPEEIVVKPISAALCQERLFAGATILGNGNLALILDPSAAAARAGLPQNCDAQKAGAASAMQTQPDEAEDPPFLLFAAGDAHGSSVGSTLDQPGSQDAASGQNQARSALPLEVVERIETVPYGRVEYAGGNAVLQFRGGTLPLWDASGLLPELRLAGRLDAPVNILVCSDRGPNALFRQDRAIGLVVREVLDVVHGRVVLPVECAPRNEAGADRRLAPPAKSEVRAMHPGGEMVLLNGRITSLFDLRRVPLAGLANSTAGQQQSGTNWQRGEVA